jgi:hypothetical protein
MSCEGCPRAQECARVLNNAIYAANQELDPATEHELGVYDGMREDALLAIHNDITQAKETDDYDSETKIELLFEERDVINAAVTSAKNALRNRHALRRVARVTTALKEKMRGEEATCPGPKEEVNYSDMGRVVSIRCQSKLRQKRLRKVSA